jgi:hypothetical protein
MFPIALWFERRRVAHIVHFGIIGLIGKAHCNVAEARILDDTLRQPLRLMACVHVRGGFRNEGSFLRNGGCGGD